MSGIFLAILGGVIYLALTPAPDKSWLKHDIAEEIFGSEANMRVFATSDTMVASRLKRISTAGNSLSNFEPVSEALVPQANMDLLRHLVQQQSSYDWGVVSYCIPEYGVLLSSRGEDGKTVQIALCFECLQFSVFEGDTLVSTLQFRKMRKRLTALIKPLFPHDPEIQALP